MPLRLIRRLLSSNANSNVYNLQNVCCNMLTKKKYGWLVQFIGNWLNCFCSNRNRVYQFSMFVCHWKHLYRRHKRPHGFFGAFLFWTLVGACDFIEAASNGKCIGTQLTNAWILISADFLRINTPVINTPQLKFMHMLIYSTWNKTRNNAIRWEGGGAVVACRCIFCVTKSIQSVFSERLKCARDLRSLSVNILYQLYL